MTASHKEARNYHMEYIISGVGGSPCNELYGEAPPERGTLFRLEVYKRIDVSRVEV